jgi:hypothetical protein
VGEAPTVVTRGRGSGAPVRRRQQRVDEAVPEPELPLLFLPRSRWLPFGGGETMNPHMWSFPIAAVK